jgi:sporulation protein YlmC with PRC-barrel domain
MAVALSLVLCPSLAKPVLAQQPTSSEAKTVVTRVRLVNGYRASKLIGSAVYNAQNQQVGSVSDLFLSKQNEVAMAVVSIGGFLGIGNKLVAVSIDKLQITDSAKVVMPGASKDELNKMPDVEYGG